MRVAVLGLGMTVPIFTYFAAAIARAAEGDRAGVYLQLGVAVALLISMTTIPRVLAGRKRRDRYRTLREQRAARWTAP